MAVAAVSPLRSDKSARSAYAAAARLVSKRMSVPLVEVAERRGGNRGWPGANVIRARHAAVYLSVVAFDQRVRAVSRVAGYTPEGVRKALRAIEDARDDPAFDQTLTELEQELAP